MTGLTGRTIAVDLIERYLQRTREAAAPDDRHEQALLCSGMISMAHVLGAIDSNDVRHFTLLFEKAVSGFSVPAEAA